MIEKPPSDCPKCKIPPGAEWFESKRYKGYKKKYEGKWILAGPGTRYYDNQKRHIKSKECWNYRGWLTGPQVRYDRNGNINKKWCVQRKLKKK